MSDYQPSKVGDRFQYRVAASVLALGLNGVERLHGATVHVTRCSRTGTWVDVRVVQDNGLSWTKRMPAGIPASWRPYRRSNMVDPDELIDDNAQYCACRWSALDWCQCGALPPSVHLGPYRAEAECAECATSSVRCAECAEVGE